MGLPNPSRETKLLGAYGYREISIFDVQLTTRRIGNLTRLILTLAICDDNTCIPVCVCVCVFIKLHITAQSGPVILVILCHSH